MIIPFPTPRNTPRLQSPPVEALVYWFCAGSLFRNIGGKGVHMTAGEARRLRYVIEGDVRREFHARNMTEARASVRLWDQLNAALDALDAWPGTPVMAARDHAPSTSAATPKSAATNHGANL